MRDPVREAKEQLKKVIDGAIEKAVERGVLPGGAEPEYNIEVPAESKTATSPPTRPWRRQSLPSAAQKE